MQFSLTPSYIILCLLFNINCFCDEVVNWNVNVTFKVIALIYHSDVNLVLVWRGQGSNQWRSNLQADILSTRPLRQSPLLWDSYNGLLCWRESTLQTVALLRSTGFRESLKNPWIHQLSWKTLIWFKHWKTLDLLALKMSKNVSISFIARLDCHVFDDFNFFCTEHFEEIFRLFCGALLLCRTYFWPWWIPVQCLVISTLW